MEGEGVRLGQDAAVGGVDGVFIGGIAFQAGHEALPHPAADGGEGQGVFLPAVEVPHQADRFGVGGPDPEDAALLAALGHRMTAQKVLEMGLFSLQKTFQRLRQAGLTALSHK